MCVGEPLALGGSELYDKTMVGENPKGEFLLQRLLL